MPEVGDGFEAKRLFDHGLHFLEYEGPISAGRGHVARVAEGEFETLLRSESEWVVRLDSESLRCRVKLTAAESPEDAWRCRFFQSAE